MTESFGAMFNNNDKLNMQSTKKKNHSKTRTLLWVLEFYMFRICQTSTAPHLNNSSLLGKNPTTFASAGNPADLSKYTECTSEELNPELTVTQLSLGVRAQRLVGLCQRYPLGGLLRAALAVQRREEHGIVQTQGLVKPTLRSTEWRYTTEFQTCHNPRYGVFSQLLRG